jgi:hypothetical protein
MEKLKQATSERIHKMQEISPEIIETEQTGSKIFKNHYLENVLSFLFYTINRVNGIVMEISPKINRIIIDYFAK